VRVDAGSRIRVVHSMTPDMRVSGDDRLTGLERSLTPVRWKRLLRRIGLVALIVLLVLAFAAIKVLYPELIDRPIAYWPDTPGYTRYIDPANEWTLRFPNSWHAQTIAEIERGGVYTTHSDGVFLSNVEGAQGLLAAPDIPSGLVAVRVALDYGGGFTAMCDHDTVLPLDLANAKPPDYVMSGLSPLRDDRGAAVTHLIHRFTVRFVALYSVQAWIGSRAPEEDLAILDQIVGSVRYSSIPMPDGWYISSCDIAGR
jgi:hypothetical protein